MNFCWFAIFLDTSKHLNINSYQKSLSLQLQYRPLLQKFRNGRDEILVQSQQYTWTPTMGFDLICLFWNLKSYMPSIKNTRATCQTCSRLTKYIYMTEPFHGILVIISVLSRYSCTHTTEAATRGVL